MLRTARFDLARSTGFHSFARTAQLFAPEHMGKRLFAYEFSSCRFHITFHPNVPGGVSEERVPSSPSARERESFEGMEGYFGWGGYGGSQMQWHPEEKIAFAYVPSFLFWIDIGNQKGRRLQREVLKCARKLKTDETNYARRTHVLD